MKVLKILVVSMHLIAPMSSYAKGGKHGGKHMKKVLSQLDLTADQKTQIKSLHEGERQNHKQAKEQMKKDKEAFKAAMSDSSVSDSKLKEMHEALINSKIAKMRSKFDKALKIRSVLTSEQQVKFRALMKEHKKNKRSRGGDRDSDDDLDY